MSYDILAFEPSAVTDADFPSWWEHTELEEHPGLDEVETTAGLKAFYAELIQTFPPLNGPDAPPESEWEADESLEARLTDYSGGPTLLYACFAWSQADAARELFVRVAARHGVAVALVSDQGQIFRP